MAYRQFAYHYDRLMADMPYSEWLDFAAHCWSLYGDGTPRTVADLGCGTGSIAIPLAAKGMKVYGIDYAEDMLAVAREKSGSAAGGSAFASGGSTIWLQQDIREWELAEPVDTAISFCDCFNYLLEEEDVAAAFRQTCRGLRPGGLFLFDMHTQRQLRSYWESQPFLLNEDDIAYIWTCGFDERRCEIEHAITFFVRETGERFLRFAEVHTQRAYPLEWVERELRRAGFAEVRRFADFTFEEPDERTNRVFFAAKKG